MNAASQLIGKQIRWVTNFEPEHSGRVFTVEKVISEPEEGVVDLECLPLFNIKDSKGNEFTVFPEEVRTLDGSHGVQPGQSPTYAIGGHPVMDIHPDVELIAKAFFEKYKHFFAA